MDRGTWQVTVHEVTKSQIQLKAEHIHMYTHTYINFTVLREENEAPGE